jgi:hypothetical protein
LELLFHHWIEPVRWVLQNDGDDFHGETFHPHEWRQNCFHRPVVTTDRHPDNSNSCSVR